MIIIYCFLHQKPSKTFIILRSSTLVREVYFVRNEISDVGLASVGKQNGVPENTDLFCNNENNLTILPKYSTPLIINQTGLAEQDMRHIKSFI